MLLWRVYLADESTFDNTQGGPDDVPRSPRVVCIAQPCAEGTWDIVLVNGDWYVWREDLGCWTEHTDIGALVELIDHAATISAVRCGKYTSKPVYNKLWARARECIAEAGGEG